MYSILEDTLEDIIFYLPDSEDSREAKIKLLIDTDKEGDAI